MWLELHMKDQVLARFGNGLAATGDKALLIIAMARAVGDGATGTRNARVIHVSRTDDARSRRSGFPSASL
jgi:hypothetical protein